MPTLERQGASIHYTVSGDGPAVVFAHSLLCDGSMWDGVFDALETEIQRITVDLRGHRHSSAPGPFSLEDLARDLVAILDLSLIHI